MTYKNYKELSLSDKTEAFRRAFGRLRIYSFVSITREMDVYVVNATGEDNAEWEVEIATHRKTVRVKSDDIEEAIISAIDLAEEEEDAAAEERSRKREGALAKLTSEERRILNLS